MKTKKLRRLVHLILPLAVLAACAGPAATPDAGVTITSPATGATITGDRTITVTAVLTDAVADATVAAQVNGAAATITRADDTVTFPATLQDNANTLTVSVQNPGQAAPVTATATVTFPFMSFTNGQPASFAIGQPDMVSVIETADDKIVNDPYGRVVIVNGVLYVPDDGLGRVMGYSEVPTASDASADFVLGKADFTDTTATASATTMAAPGSLATDGQRLFVTDYTNSRVLVFDTAPTTSGAPASYAIGQPDLVTGTYACSATGLNHPESVTYAAGRLIVTDTSNNRVLIWNSAPDTFGVTPDVVLGQGSFTTCAADDDD